jgi:hypothetical protein
MVEVEANARDLQFDTKSRDRDEHHFRLPPRRGDVGCVSLSIVQFRTLVVQILSTFLSRQPLVNIAIYHYL